MSLDGKLALITGGGRGIGRAIALRLAQGGARVVVTGRTRSELDLVAKETGGVAVVADLADRAALAGMLEEIASRAGRVDILVNNAGIADSAPLDRTSDELWDRLLELNATVPFRLCRALVPAMVTAGWGRVINVASTAGLTGAAYTAAYCASKHALVGMTRALAVDLARTGVTINALCPSWVDTDMVTQTVARISAKTKQPIEQARAVIERMIPQHRLIQPEEVAHAAAMLCDHAARGIHGTTLLIDGGQVMK